MTRFIDLPFAYRVTGVPKGMRAKVSRVFASSIPVQLTEAGDADAPLAARIAGTAFRRSEDGFLAPVVGTDRKPLTLNGLLSLLADKRRCSRWDKNYPLWSPAEGLLHSPFHAKPEKDFRVVSSDFELCQGRARLVAAKLRLIDGYVWGPSPEPCFVVCTKGLGVVGDIAIHAMWRADYAYLQDAAFFRLDQREVALDFARDLAKRYGKRASRVPDGELLRPDLLRFDPARAMANLMASRLCAEKRELEMSSFLLDRDPARCKAEELFRAIDSYRDDPAAVLAAAHQLMSHEGDSACVDLMRESSFPVLGARLAAWAGDVGLTYTIEDGGVTLGLLSSV